MKDRVCQSLVVLWSESSFAGRVWLGFFSVAAFWLLALPGAPCQVAATAVGIQIPLGTDAASTVPAGKKSAGDKAPVEQEITVEGMVSYGDYRIFGATARCDVWTAGVEYDRHMFGRHLKAQIDYVAEVLPFVLLSQPVSADYWGNPLSPNQELVPGLGVSPIGFRLLWRAGRRIKPYMIAKGGAIAFTRKALSPDASYANYNWQGEAGVEIRLTDRVELRLGPIEHFHVSNGHMNGSNPGMDELAGKFGVSYHLGRR
jgi:hypothetical protein